MANVRIFEVLHDTAGDGPHGDGLATFRTRDRKDAESFAAGHTCYHKPATVEPVEVPVKLARRWGL